MRILFNNTFLNSKENCKFTNFATNLSASKTDISSDVVSFSGKTIPSNFLSHNDRNYMDNIDPYTPVFSFQVPEEETNLFLHDFLTSFNQDYARRYLFQFSSSLPIEAIRENFVRPRYKDLQTEVCQKANIKTIDDYLKCAHIYGSKDTYEVFKNSPVDFFEIYSLLDDKYNLEHFPEFLYYLNLQANYESNDKKKELFNHYTQILEKLNIKNSEDLHQKFSHLSYKFNNFENFDDDKKVLNYINENYQNRIEFLNPISEKFSTNKRLDAPAKIYASIPDIVDFLYENNSEENFQEFFKYAPMAVSFDKISTDALSLVQDSFNSFQSAQDKISFYKKLNKNNLSITEFNKLYSNSVVNFKNPICKINNMSNIVDFISNKSGFNKQKAREFYLKFADILNAVYISENTDIDILSETVDFIKKYKISDSKQFLNCYNNCNASKNNSLEDTEISTFVDLMRFADNSTVQINKKYKTSVFDNLSKTKNDFLNIKDFLDDFLINNENGISLSETSLSLFNKYKKQLVGLSEAQINKKLEDIAKFNIKNEAEYNRKIHEIEKFSKFFNSRDDLLQFLSDNEIQLDVTPENEEYRENCLFVLEALYDDENIENSKRTIEKLSDSKFLIKSKSSLTSFKNDWFRPYSHSDILNLFLDRKIPSYQSFKEFYSSLKTDKSHYSDLISLFEKLPKDVDFNTLSDLVISIKEKLHKTSYPISFNLTNAKNLEYEDFLNISNSEAFPPVIINKLLNCSEEINPTSLIPNVQTYYMDDIDALQVAIELVNVKYSHSVEKYDNLFRILKLNREDLGLNKYNSKYTYINSIAHNIPETFMKFINSISKINDNKNYNMSIHSVLRLVDRFLAKDCETVNQLCSPHRLQKANEILASVYEQCPYLIKNDTKTYSRMVIKNKYNGEPITSIFSKEGKMITIFDDYKM